MSHWVLLVAPLVLASSVMLFAFVGCGLNTRGTGADNPPDPETPETYKDLITKHPNLAGYWRLDELKGAAKAADSSTKGNDGAYVGNVTLEQPGLLVGDEDTAAQFDGSGGHVELPSVLDPTGPFTVECLVRSDALSGLPTIISQLDGAGTGRALLFVGASGNYTSNFGGMPLDSGVTAAVGKIHHLAFTSAGGAGGEWVFYVDGDAAATGTVTGEPATGGLLIGVNKLLAEPWNGTIDEVAVYDAALDLATIQTHAELATTGPPQ